MVKRRYLQVLLSGLLVAEWGIDIRGGTSEGRSHLCSTISARCITRSPRLPNWHRNISIKGSELVYAFNHERPSPIHRGLPP